MDYTVFLVSNLQWEVNEYTNVRTTSRRCVYIAVGHTHSEVVATGRKQMMKSVQVGCRGNRNDTTGLTCLTDCNDDIFHTLRHTHLLLLINRKYEFSNMLYVQQ